MASGRHVAESHGIRHQPRLDLRAGHVQSRYDRAPSRRGHYLDLARRSSGSFGGCSPFGENVLLSDGDVIGRHVGLRSVWAQFLPFLQCPRSFWVLFKEPSELLRLLARSGDRSPQDQVPDRPTPRAAPAPGTAAPTADLPDLTGDSRSPVGPWLCGDPATSGLNQCRGGPCAEAGDRFRAVQPAGEGVLDQDGNASTTFDTSNNLRSQIPRFAGEALQHNLALVEEVRGVAEGQRCDAGSGGVGVVVGAAAVDRADPGTTKLQ
jgi:hypothetical protein